jgi:polyferredoxin
MPKNPLKDDYKKFVKMAIGTFILILGTTLILAWWGDVVSLFRGGIGIVLAIGGLLTLYTITLKQ